MRLYMNGLTQFSFQVQIFYCDSINFFMYANGLVFCCFFIAFPFRAIRIEIYRELCTVSNCTYIVLSSEKVLLILAIDDFFFTCKINWFLRWDKETKSVPSSIWMVCSKSPLDLRVLPTKLHYSLAIFYHSVDQIRVQSDCFVYSCVWRKYTLAANEIGESQPILAISIFNWKACTAYNLYAQNMLIYLKLDRILCRTKSNDA